VLPLRLSVDRGALSIELTRPHALPGLIVEALDVHLEGVAFPVDLSRGVKQFRNRRGSLRRLLVRLDLDALGRRLLAAAHDVLGEPALGVRVQPAPLTDAPGAAATDAGVRADNDATAPALGVIGVAVFGAERALAFDLVLAPGSPPSFIVDAARGFGLQKPALALVLTLLDRALRESPLEVVQKGRSLELGGLARALLAEIFPSLGFRAPRVGGHVVHRAVFGPEGISLLIVGDEDSSPVGARAVRLAGLATFTRAADECLAGLDFDGARSEFLQVLERVPNHPEVLLNLAEIDAASPLRAESALAFLEEAVQPELASRPALIACRALAESLRHDLALEALEQVVARETDGTIAALAHCAIAARRTDPGAVLVELDRAVSRAPLHPAPRWRRLERTLGDGTLPKALVDAQALEAASPAGAERARVLGRLGRTFASFGLASEAVAWLRRALAITPDDAGVLLDLAGTLERLGEGLRAAELYQAALIRAEEAEAPSSLDLDAARLALARLLARETRDPALALGYLRRVGSRAKDALAARELEIELARKVGDTAALRSAALRLIQALELGWIVSDRTDAILAEVSVALRGLGQDDLADHAARVAAMRAQHGRS